ncbi:MAG: hypothetical protein SGBAC_006164 [Bacillariaceae sp.]
MKFLCLLSPTKALAEKSCKEFTASSNHKIAALAKPRSILLERAQELKQSEIKSMMKLSDSLAKLNYDRYQTFENQPTYPAGWLFDGPSFQKLNIHDFSDEELDRLDSSLCILSGLYGFLRPKDPMQPYRLEMGTRLAVNDETKNLYEFWKQHGLTKQVAEFAASEEDEKRCILNCASQEYSKVLDFAELRGKENDLQVVDVVFQAANGGRMASVFAKQARGMFVRYVAKANPTSLESLQGFTGDGHYVFASQSDDKVVFERHATPQSDGDEALWGGTVATTTKPVAGTKSTAPTKKAKKVPAKKKAKSASLAKKDSKPRKTAAAGKRGTDNKHEEEQVPSSKRRRSTRVAKGKS